MSDTNTEWRAKVDEDRGWCVFEGENIVADLLRPEDAHKIAAVNELEAALELILPMAKGYAARHKVGSNAEYIKTAAAALAKARGEQ